MEGRGTADTAAAEREMLDQLRLVTSTSQADGLITFGSVTAVDGLLKMKVIFDFSGAQRDEPFKEKPPRGEKILNAIDLDNFSREISAEINEGRNKAVTEYVKTLEEKKPLELLKLAAGVRSLGTETALGRVKCPVCRGKARGQCALCKGTGSIKCPICHGNSHTCRECGGQGRITCTSCKGTGVAVCRTCSGNGQALIRRQIAMSVKSKNEVTYTLNRNSNEKFPELTLDQDTILDLARHCQLTLQEHGYDKHGCYRMLFSARCTCYRMPIFVKGSQESHIYSVCTEDPIPVEKPPVLDAVFAQDYEMLASAVSPDNKANMDAKIACCRTLAQKSMLARTLQQVEQCERKVIDDMAIGDRISEDDLYDAESTPQLEELRRQVMQKEHAMLCEFFLKQTQGFATRTFIAKFCNAMLGLAPLLRKINPNSGTIWLWSSLIVWVLVVALLFVVPSDVMLLWCLLISVGAAVGVTTYVTKNMRFIQAVRALHLQRNGQQVPSVKPETLYGARMVAVAVIFEVIMKILWFD